MRRSISQIPVCLVLFLVIVSCGEDKGNSRGGSSATAPTITIGDALPRTATPEIDIQILPTAEIAPPFETIEEDMARLVADAKAKTSNTSHFAEWFSDTDAYFKFQDSIRGKRVAEWDGWVNGIIRVASVSTVDVTMTDPMYVSKDYPEDVYLNGISLSELEKLRLWPYLTPWPGGKSNDSIAPQHIKFSGTITAAQWYGLVSLTDVSLQPLD